MVNWVFEKSRQRVSIFWFELCPWNFFFRLWQVLEFSFSEVVQTMQDLRTLTLEAWHSDSHVKNCIGIWLKNCYYNASSMPHTAKNDYSQVSLFLCLIMPSDCRHYKNWASHECKVNFWCENGKICLVLFCLKNSSLNWDCLSNDLLQDKTFL